MRVRLTMICSGVSPAVRRGAFPCGEAAEPAWLMARATALSVVLRRPDRVWCGPAASARQVAEALGLQASEMEALRDQDYGAWAGRSFAEMEATALEGWMGDPQATPPGGESFEAVFRRVSDLMEGLVNEPGHIVAITHAPVIRAAVLHVVGAPLSGASHIDVEPLSLTDFRSDGRRWTLRATGISASVGKQVPGSLGAV